MTEPEFDYAHLLWFLKRFVCSISIDGQKVLHRLLLFIYFPASISQEMVKKGGSGACYASGFVNDLFQRKCSA